MDLQQAKITARLKLNQLPADCAQDRADVLNAKLWQPDITDLINCDFFQPNLIFVTKLTPPELKEIFLKLQSEALELVLVGGQAINFWATYYQDRVSKLKYYLPFSSEDIDFFGGRLEASICHQILGGKLKLNQNFDPSPNTGVLLIKYNEAELRIDFLATVFGLNDTEIVESAIAFQGQGEINGISFKIINPVLCVESKLKSLVGLPQQGRQDLKHLKIALLCCQEFLRDICPQESARSALKLIERLVRNSLSDAGLQVWLNYGIEIDSAIPLDLISSLPEKKWTNFCHIRLPQIKELINRKRLKYREIFGTEK